MNINLTKQGMFGPLALKGRELFGGDVVCRGNGVSQAPSHVDKQHGLENGPHGQNHALLYNFWASYRLCAHLVYKGVGTFYQLGCPTPE